MPIAVNTEDANAQHYEVPTEFYQLVLGKRLKYSSAYFPQKNSSLDEAEEAMFALYAERAQLKDGQSVLDVGCGWGSLSMYIAEKYPNSKVTGVSNSETQKAFITEECSKRGLSNVTIVTCDINVFNIENTFDRILSIEMFEHMKNYEKLLKKISSWLKPDGLLFVHIFVHKSIPYHFEDQGEDDWMSRNFFTGGTMPSNGLLLYFQDDVSIVNQWFVNGTHYALTSEAWLVKMDAQIKVIRPIFAKAYGEGEVTKWVANWRTFFIAVAEMFAYRNGEEWGVGHYLFKKK
ncbi:hypothetical protein M758_2G030300 [Ceratodon purpureus]|nr:hypothetical protein M758_2G030300 [Ceratodon purpureus]